MLFLAFPLKSDLISSAGLKNFKPMLVLGYVREGKRHLKFQEYTPITQEILSSGFNLSRKAVTEMHYLLLLAWNLCVRADSATLIHACFLDGDNNFLKSAVQNPRETIRLLQCTIKCFATPLILSYVLCFLLPFIGVRAVADHMNRQRLGSHSILQGAITFAQHELLIELHLLLFRFVLHEKETLDRHYVK
jgi:hypothetical protein